MITCDGKLFITISVNNGCDSSQDKRRVQEDIAKKRRQIEEEKLKLQYLKASMAQVPSFSWS